MSAVMGVCKRKKVPRDGQHLKSDVAHNVSERQTDGQTEILKKITRLTGNIQPKLTFLVSVTCKIVFIRLILTILSTR